MITAAVTGGYGTGKSTVLRLFRQMGAEVSNADETAHRLMCPGTVLWERIVASFGCTVLRRDMHINRKKLGRIVFGDSSLLKRLNTIMHPAVKKEIKRIVREKKKNREKGVFVMEVPLLFETGMEKIFDMVIAVRCTRTQQIKRTMKRDNINRGRAEERINAQMPMRETVRRADFVIDNKGPVSETRRRGKNVWNILNLVTCSSDVRC